MSQPNKDKPKGMVNIEDEFFVGDIQSKFCPCVYASGHQGQNHKIASGSQIQSQGHKIKVKFVKSRLVSPTWVDTNACYTYTHLKTNGGDSCR